MIIHTRRVQQEHQKMYQHVKHSGWGIHWNDINTGRLILHYCGWMIHVPTLGHNLNNWVTEPKSGPTRHSALPKINLHDYYNLSFVPWGFKNAEIWNIYIVMKTSLDPLFRLPFQSISSTAYSVDISVIQHYPTLIDINNDSVDLAYCFKIMSPFLTLILFENL